MSNKDKNTKNSKNSSELQENTFREIFEDKSTTSVVVATVILLLLSFFAFRYFGSSNYVDEQLNGSGASDIALETNTNSGGETQSNVSSEVAGGATVVQEQPVDEQEQPQVEEAPEEQPVQEQPQVEEAPEEQDVSATQEQSTDFLESSQQEDQTEVKEQQDNGSSSDVNTEEPQEQVQQTVETAETEESTSAEEVTENPNDQRQGFFSRLFGNRGQDNDNSEEDQTNTEGSDESTDTNVDTAEDNEDRVAGDNISYTTWRANDLQPNSLQGDSYTVNSGDTLWEIAEAYYGNGADWVKIANANNVSYLSNGNPLILPGQNLVIP